MKLARLLSTATRVTRGRIERAAEVRKHRDGSDLSSVYARKRLL